MPETQITQEQIQTIVEALFDGATLAQTTGVSQETLEQLYALGHGFYASGNFENALTVFQALSLYDNRDYRFWFGLGATRQALEQFQGAVDAYQMAAIASSLSNPTPYLHMADCLIKLGNKPDAVTALEAAAGTAENDASYADVHARAKALLALLTQK